MEKSYLGEKDGLLLFLNIFVHVWAHTFVFVCDRYVYIGCAYVCVCKGCLCTGDFQLSCKPRWVLQFDGDRMSRCWERF